jgi:hypothetical protein
VLKTIAGYVGGMGTFQRRENLPQFSRATNPKTSGKKIWIIVSEALFGCKGLQNSKFVVR